MADPAQVSVGGGEVREWASRYTVNALPVTVPERDRHLWDVSVESRGHDLWAVCWKGSCLDEGAVWDYEPIPSSRTDEWLEAHRFDLDRSLELARAIAPFLIVNGHTVEEMRAKHDPT